MFRPVVLPTSPAAAANRAHKAAAVEDCLIALIMGVSVPSLIRAQNQHLCHAQVSSVEMRLASGQKLDVLPPLCAH